VPVGPQVVDPHLLGPWGVGARLFVKEQHVRLYSLRVEDAGRQPQQGVDVALGEELAADRFSGTAFEQDVIGDDNRGSAVDLEQRTHMLHEVELFVGGRSPEVVPHDGERFSLLDTFLIDHADARLLAEWRIGQHEIEASPWIGAETVVDLYRRFDLAVRRADAVEHEVHRAQASDAFGDLDAAERFELQVP